MIEVAGVSFTYHRSGTAAVRGLDFRIEPGEIFGFLGPSGAGKSTTQKILIRLLLGYEGRAEVLGREVRRWDKSLYERVGVSFELPNHYARLTALENLRHFAAIIRRKLSRRISRLSLRPKARMLRAVIRPSPRCGARRRGATRRTAPPARTPCPDSPRRQAGGR